MSSEEHVLLILSNFLRTLERNFNKLFLFPKELKQLISLYYVNVNIWHTSITYENIKFSDDNKTVIFNEPDKSIFGIPSYNINQISESLNLDFKIDSLGTNHLYLGFLSIETGI